MAKHRTRWAALTGAVLVVAILHAYLWLRPTGLAALHNVEAENARIAASNAELQAAILRMERTTERFAEHSESVAALARDMLGWVAEDEVFYRVIPEKATSSIHADITAE